MALRVLLVDDKRDTRVGLAQRLERSEGLELAGAASGAEEARGALSQGRPDVVLLNIHRRDGQEVELCRALCSFTDAPLVLLASFMTAERWDEMKRAGAVDYLLKRVDTKQLSQKLIGVVASRAS
ncbi:MAG: response regulator [Dehalococcoidia bacterium]|nr:response regulator [Dehalococcoidia bacterium]